MSMTREETITNLEKLAALFYTASEQSKMVDYSKIIETLEFAAAALRPVSREPLEKFKEFFDDLYGKGLEVYGWHMNGEAKSFDDFYEDACEYAGL